MYLSYSGFKKHEDCPRQYWHSYINKTKYPLPDNRVGMLYGSIVGTVFEHFYNDKLWRSPDPVAALQALVQPIADETVRKELRSGVFNWKDPKLKKGPKSMVDVLASVRESIPNGLDIIRNYRLLGVGAKAEIKLDSDIGGHTLGGRSDFIMTRVYPHRDRIIVDGKGSAHRDKYVDKRQLEWSGMLHRKKLGGIPDQLAFLYWRSSPETAVDWFTPTEASIDELQDSVLSAIGTIESRAKERTPEAFPARAREFNCKFCPFVPLCPEGQAMVAVVTSENRPSVSSGEGVEDVSLGD